MVHPYLKRRQGKEKVIYPNRDIRRILERTLGVPIFQEQVIQLAMIAAGFTPGEADDLRHSISSWKRHGDLHNYEERLINGMRERGYSKTFAHQLYQQIRGFGEYGFPESHAASFALLVYISAWLKCYEPAIFTCALLNNQPMGFYGPSQLIQDAQRHGVKVLPVDVTTSNWNCTIEQTDDSRALRLGLRIVKNLSQNGGERLVAARTKRIFRDTDDLTYRAQLNYTDLQALAIAGALNSIIYSHRRQAIWNISGLQPRIPIFSPSHDAEAIPMLRRPNETEETCADYASMGLTLGTHPIALLRPQLIELRCVTSREVHQHASGNIIQVAGLVVTRQKPSTAKQVTFVTLEDETGSVNLIVWGSIAKKHRQILSRSTLLGAWGIIQKKDNVLHLITKTLLDYTHMLNNLTTHSRNFH